MIPRRRHLSTIALAFFLGHAGAAPALGPTSWDVKVIVSAQGDYGWDSGEVRIAGRFEFTIVWTGALHADDEDYLLIHGETTVSDWKAEEKSLAAENVTISATADFPEKPELRVNYILRLEDGLHVDFIVHGFEVPLGAPADRFLLRLPASAENGESVGGPKYGLSLVSGSNAVALDEKAIRRGPAEETFRWIWKSRNWVQRQDRTILQTQGHSAKIKVRISPRPLTPGGGTGRTRGAAGRG